MAGDAIGGVFDGALSPSLERAFAKELSVGRVLGTRSEGIASVLPIRARRDNEATRNDVLVHFLAEVQGTSNEPVEGGN